MASRARVVCLFVVYAAFHTNVLIAAPNQCQTAARDVQDAVARYRAAVRDVAMACGRQSTECHAARAAADTALNDVITAHAALMNVCIVAPPPPPPPPPPPGTGDGRVIINEVDYDQVGTDSGEFVEIYNPGTAAVSLTGLAVVFVNGADNTEYQRINLSGALDPGGYAVIASPNVTLPVGTLVFPFEIRDNNIQNGAPDGIAIVDTATGAVVDALSYEGSITNAVIIGLGTVSLVEGIALPVSVADSNTVIGSLARFPNGQDTDSAANDWMFVTTPTPGAPQ